MQINRIFYLKEKIKFSDDLKINLRKRERIKNGFNFANLATFYDIMKGFHLVLGNLLKIYIIEKRNE